jgi:hypothetical protein
MRPKNTELGLRFFLTQYIFLSTNVVFLTLAASASWHAQLFLARRARPNTCYTGCIAVNAFVVTRVCIVLMGIRLLSKLCKHAIITGGSLCE